jgi:hypothetical protein
MRISMHSPVLVIAALTVFIFMALNFSGASVSHAAAPGTTPITGYAYSETTGWVSLDCSDSSVCGTNNYGIGVDSSGILSGYAWSDNIGWVSANTADLSGCPTPPCTATLVDNALSGWLKAVGAAGDGWDGWISLKGSGYGPTESNGVFSGYAWGSEVVGWVDFSDVRTAYITDACPNIAGVQATIPQGYSLQAGICVQCQYTCPTQTSVHDSCTGATTQCGIELVCSAGSSLCVAPISPSFIQSGDKSGHLQIRPQLVRKGGATKVFWNVDNVTDCTVNSSTDSWAGETSGPSGQTSSPINQQTVFTLSCTGLDGSNIHETATVGVVPVFQEV